MVSFGTSLACHHCAADPKTTGGGDPVLYVKDEQGVLILASSGKKKKEFESSVGAIRYSEEQGRRRADAWGVRPEKQEIKKGGGLERSPSKAMSQVDCNSSW